MFCNSQLLCTRGSLHLPWTQTHSVCAIVGLKNPSNTQSSFFSMMALSFRSLLLAYGQCKGGGSCLSGLQEGREFSKHHQRNFGRSVLSCISDTLVLEPWNSLQSARSVELREHLPVFSEGPSGGTPAYYALRVSAHEIALQDTAHATRADCTLAHLPPEQCQSINHMQSCAADLNDAYAASCCRYISHMGAYAKCPCLEKDLQTSNRLMVPPYTVCCTTV